MRLSESGCAAVLAAAGALYSFSSRASADEPIKPTPSASAANPAVPAPGHSLHGEAFNDGPRHAAHLIPGMGKVGFAVTTAKPEAQKFIDQGVAQLHSFYYFGSERSFRQAAKIDPGCAMAYWGMAMSNVNNPKRAKGFLKEARKRAAGISPREVLYLTALESFHQDGANDRARRQGLLKGLESIVQDFPGDIDARAWLAMVTWQNSMDGGIGSRQAVDIVLDTVLEGEPMHPGAHHYRIHLWDGQKAVRAEKSAAFYAKTATGIAHAWHMPGHTYTELKRYADAAYQQEGSARVDHAYMARDRVMPFEIHNYAHNNQWLCTSLSHIGRVRDAIAVARNLAEQPRDPAKNGPNDGGSPQRSGRAGWSELLTRYELWDDLIAATSTGALDWSNIPFELEQKAHALGLAYAARNEPDKLATQIDALRKLTSSGAKSALAELEGLQALARGDVGPAFDSFAKATSMRPEALARAHLKARNFGFAEVKAREAVAKNPNQVLPLAAQVEILHACGKDKEAREAYRALEPLARSADQDAPIFRRLAGIVNQWKSDKSLAREAGEPAPGVPLPSVVLVPDGPRTKLAAEMMKTELEYIKVGAEICSRLADSKIGDEVEKSIGELEMKLQSLKAQRVKQAKRYAQLKADESAAGNGIHPERTDLKTLGSLTWAPFAAEPFSREDTTGAKWSLAEKRGKNVLLLFFLGGKCAHCMQQLQLFAKEQDALKKLSVETVAIGTDDLEASKLLKNNKDGIKFPMPILPDPKLEIFELYQAHDDFEGQPLHGTILIDAQGNVRFQRISADPFLDVEFIKTEAERVSRIVAKK